SPRRIAVDEVIRLGAPPGVLEAQLGAGRGLFQPEDEARAVPLVAGVAAPLRMPALAVDLETHAIERGAVEESELDGVARFGDVLRPPARESPGGGDERVDGLWLGANCDGVANVGHGNLLGGPAPQGNRPPVPSQFQASWADNESGLLLLAKGRPCLVSIASS